MSRALLTIRGTADRDPCLQVDRAGTVRNARSEFKAIKRSIPQNDRFWAMMTDVATQLVWHGQKLRPDDWKLVFLDALKREQRCVPNIDNDGFVNLGRSSSDLSKSEMSELIELIAAFGAQHGVTFHDSEQDAA